MLGSSETITSSLLSLHGINENYITFKNMKFIFQKIDLCLSRLNHADYTAGFHFQFEFM